MDEVTLRELAVAELVQAPFAAALRGCHLDRPRPSTPGTSFDVIGWVIPKTGSVDRVEVRANQIVLAETPLNHHRPDLADAFPDVPGAEQAGFRVAVSVVKAPADGNLQVEAVLDNGIRVPIGIVRLRESPSGVGGAAIKSAPESETLRESAPDRPRRSWLPWKR